MSNAQQRAVVGAVVVWHVALGYGLLQVREVREVVTEAVPIFVSLLAPSAPEPPVPVPPPPMAERTAPPRMPSPRPVIVAVPSPAPAVFTTTPAPPMVEPPAPVLPAPAEVAMQTPATPPLVAPPAPPPAPKTIPPSAVQYLEQVMPVYSQASARAHEAGRVVVRLFIDETGLPRDVSVHQSSGFVRLDEAWSAAVRKARFKPPTLNGQPISGWAMAAFDFQL